MIKEEKKKYCRPNIEIISIDRDISLIMMTDSGDPGGGDIEFASKKGTTSVSETDVVKDELSSNPFGKK